MSIFFGYGLVSELHWLSVKSDWQHTTNHIDCDMVLGRWHHLWYLCCSLHILDGRHTVKMTKIEFQLVGLMNCIAFSVKNNQWQSCLRRESIGETSPKFGSNSDAGRTALPCPLWPIAETNGNAFGTFWSCGPWIWNKIWGVHGDACGTKSMHCPTRAGRTLRTGCSNTNKNQNDGTNNGKYELFDQTCALASFDRMRW